MDNRRLSGPGIALILIGAGCNIVWDMFPHLLGWMMILAGLIMFVVGEKPWFTKILNRIESTKLFKSLGFGKGTKTERKLPKSLSELFKSDFPECIKYSLTHTITIAGKGSYELKACIYMSFHTNTLFLGYFFAESPLSFEIARGVSTNYRETLKELEGIDIIGKSPGDSTKVALKDLSFTKKVYIYHEDDFSPQQIGEIHAAFESRGLNVQLRGDDYRIARWNDERFKASNGK